MNAFLAGLALIILAPPAPAAYRPESEDVHWTGVHTWTSSATFQNADFSIGASTFVVTGGRVGIGSANPATALDVAGGTVTASGFLAECPSGFTSVAAAGRQLGCIQTAERGSGDWPTALEDCFDTYGGRLPYHAEWYLAVNNFALTDETDDAEWLADSEIVSSQGEHASVVATTGIVNNNNTAHTTSLAYRCWIPK